MIGFIKKIFGLKPCPRCATEPDASMIKLLELSEEDRKTLKSLNPEIVVGKILEIRNHPDPKITKVKITQCKISPDEEVQILCGGQNIHPGQIVPVAKVGSDLPGDFKIQERDIRGEISRGMICARKELGLSLAGEQEKEIWPLPPELEVCLGQSLCDL